MEPIWNVVVMVTATVMVTAMATVTATEKKTSTPPDIISIHRRLLRKNPDAEDLCEIVLTQNTSEKES